MSSPQHERLAVVLIGHGAPATDCPPQLVGELMSLEWRKTSAADGETPGASPNGRPGSRQAEDRVAELDAAIRNWPRHADNDPYRVGLERLAQVLRPLLPTDLVAVGYNEFCRPSVAEAVDEVVQRGATRVLVIPSMLTPGGLHAEHDIPRALEAVRRAHPRVTIEYLWPFDLHQVAALLASHVAQALSARQGHG